MTDVDDVIKVPEGFGYTFRRLEEDLDWEFILELCNDSEWIKHIRDEGITDEASAKAYIRERHLASYAKWGFGLWLVSSDNGWQDEDNTMHKIGLVGLLKRSDNAELELGYALLKKWRGKNKAFQACEMCLSCAVDHLNAQTVIANISPGNEKSLKLLMRLRFDEGELDEQKGTRQYIWSVKERERKKFSYYIGVTAEGVYEGMYDRSRQVYKRIKQYVGGSISVYTNGMFVIYGLDSSMEMMQGLEPAAPLTSALGNEFLAAVQAAVGKGPLRGLPETLRGGFFIQGIELGDDKVRDVPAYLSGILGRFFDKGPNHHPQTMCSWCRKPSEKPLKRCGRCHAFLYCSTFCQRSDWFGLAHCKSCKKFAKEMEGFSKV